MPLLRVPQGRRPADIRSPQQPPVYGHYHRDDVNPRLRRPERVVHRGLPVVVTDPEGRAVAEQELEHRHATSSSREVNYRLPEAVRRPHVHPASRQGLECMQVSPPYRLYKWNLWIAVQGREGRAREEKLSLPVCARWAKYDSFHATSCVINLYFYTLKMNKTSAPRSRSLVNDDAGFRFPLIPTGRCDHMQQHRVPYHAWHVITMDFGRIYTMAECGQV